MMNLNDTITWLSDNATVTVKDDVYNLIKFVSETADTNIKTIDMMEKIEKNINSPEAIKKILVEYTATFIAFFNEFEESTVKKLDDDIFKMLARIENDKTNL